MIDNQNFQMSMLTAPVLPYENGIIEHDLFMKEFGCVFYQEFLSRTAFDFLRDKFIGPYRTEDNPITVEKGHCSSSFELGNNLDGSLQEEHHPGARRRNPPCIHAWEGKPGKRDAGCGKIQRSTAEVDLSMPRLRSYWNNKFDKLRFRPQ